MLDMVTLNRSFSVRYSGWHVFRTEILFATFRYLQVKHDTELPFLIEEGPDQGREDWQFQYRKFIPKTRDSFCNSLQPPYNNDAIDRFIRACHSDFKVVNMMNRYGVGGIVPLCDKNDADGYYTPGNSMDILTAMHLIHPYITEEQLLGKCWDELTALFEDSVATETNVELC